MMSDTGVADAEHLLHLANGLNEQRKKNEFCDIQLKVAGRTLPTHASVLSAASPYFRGLIAACRVIPLPTSTSSNWPQQIELTMPSEVTGSDEDLAVMLDLLDYIYTGKIILKPDRLDMVVLLAEAFMLDGLTVLVRNYGVELLTTEEMGQSSAAELCRVKLTGGVSATDPAPQQSDGGEDDSVSLVRRFKRKVEPRKSTVTRSAVTTHRSFRKRTSGSIRGGQVSKTANMEVVVLEPTSAVTNDDPAPPGQALPEKTVKKPRRKSSRPGQGRSYRCRVKDCDFLSGDAKAILEHRLVHSANHTFACVTCSFMSGRWKKLLDHLLGADHAEETRCSLCGYEATDPEGLRRHLERHAEDPTRPYFCDGCEMRFVNPSQVAAHVIKHTTERPFVCTQCGRGFKWRHCLYSHMQMHKDKEHICDQCGFRTAYKFTLRMHLRIHSGETFPCSHCDYRATRKQLLDLHVAAKHSTERRFQCEVCGLKFSVLTAYRSHSKIHNLQENLRFCPHCSFKTVRNSRLREHMRKLHAAECPS